MIPIPFAEYSPHVPTDPKVDLARCRASVFENYRSHQCQNPAKYGKWCGTHDPERAAARAAKRPPTQRELECAARAAAAKRLAALEAVAEAARATEKAYHSYNACERTHGYDGEERFMDAIDALREALARLADPSAPLTPEDHSGKTTP